MLLLAGTDDGCGSQPDDIPHLYCLRCSCPDHPRPEGARVASQTAHIRLVTSSETPYIQNDQQRHTDEEENHVGEGQRDSRFASLHADVMSLIAKGAESAALWLGKAFICSISYSDLSLRWPTEPP